MSWSLIDSANIQKVGYATAMWLMQDGTVLAHILPSGGGTQLLVLRPDGEGRYVNGSWSSAGNFILAKNGYASAILSDGRLITCGGENTWPVLGQNSVQSETNECEIYDPLFQSSSPLSPPPGWTAIGDSPSVVLNDGTFLLGNTQGKGSQVALLDPSTLTWTFGGGDQDNEQGYTLLQTGDVLTASVFSQTSMRYDPSAQAFVEDAGLPVMLGATIAAEKNSPEIGPGITLMDGRVIWFGATGHTCIYTPGAEGGNGTWVQGPGLPTVSGDQLYAADVFAMLEPNGNVLLEAAGQNTPPVLLEYNPVLNSFTIVENTPVDIIATTSSIPWTTMLLLPNGHGLVSFPTGNWYDVEFAPGGDASWAPTITYFPPTVGVNSTVPLSGTQLCGLSECQNEGDDNQQAENYPMVRLVDSSGGVTYLRAHDVSTRSIAPGEPGTVLVDIPAGLPLGAYTVEAVAMGISSAGTAVKVMAEGMAPPVISSIDPSTGSTLGGTQVLIQGSGLAGATAVLFGGTVGHSVNTLAEGMIEATSPPGSAGPTDITVAVNGPFSSPNPAAVFTYVYAPGVTGITVNPDILWTGQSATGTVTLNEPAPPGGTTVELVVSGGFEEASFVTVPATVLVPAGDTSATFTITTSATAWGVATITAGGPDGNALSTSVEIFAGQIVIALPLPAGYLLIGQTATGTISVRTPAPASGGLITLSTSNSAVVGITPAVVDLPSGSTSATFTVTALSAGVCAISANYLGDSATTNPFVVRQQPPPKPPRPPGPKPI